MGRAFCPRWLLLSAFAPPDSPYPALSPRPAGSPLSSPTSGGDVGVLEKGEYPRWDTWSSSYMATAHVLQPHQDGEWPLDRARGGGGAGAGEASPRCDGQET